MLFGLEREWVAKLKLEAAAVDSRGADLGDIAAVTIDIADALDAAGGVLQLTASVGDLFDGTGEVIDGVGGLFDAFGP